MRDRDLLAAIHDVFDGVRREGGTTLHEAEAESIFMSDAYRRRIAKAHAVPEHWGAILDDELDRFRHDLVFLDWKGFRFYLPAYMGWSIRNHRAHPGWVEDDFFLRRLGRYGPKRSHVMCEYIDRFSDAERQVIAAFLAHLIVEHRSESARDCLKVGWRAYLVRARGRPVNS